MNTSVLATIAIAQGVFLVMLLAMLLTRRVVGGIRLGRSRQQLELAARAVSRWQTGEVDTEHMLNWLGRLSFADFSLFFQNLSTQMGGEDWNRLAAAARQTAWFDRVCDYGESRLWWRRLLAARAFMVVGAQEDLSRIEALLRDDAAPVRRAAVWCLKRVQSPELAAAVLDIAAREPRVLQATILEVLAGNRGPVLGTLTERLQTATDAGDLGAALRLAEMIGVPGLLTHVLPHAAHSEFEVRIAATRALASYPHVRTSQTLCERLRDPVWQVRAQAAAGLGAIGAREAVEELDHAMTDASWWVRLRSALALRRLGSAGVAVLEARQPESDRFAYEMAQYVLQLDRAAVAEYSGPYVVDYAEATASHQAA